VEDGGSIMLVTYATDLEERVKKLKALMLLVGPVVSDVQMNVVAIKQWEEYLRCFPGETV
jgi:hypothetical protein